HGQQARWSIPDIASCSRAAPRASQFARSAQAKDGRRELRRQTAGPGRAEEAKAPGLIALRSSGAASFVILLGASTVRFPGVSDPMAVRTKLRRRDPPRTSLARTSPRERRWSTFCSRRHHPARDDRVLVPTDEGKSRDDRFSDRASREGIAIAAHAPCGLGAKSDAGPALALDRLAGSHGETARRTARPRPRMVQPRARDRGG